MNKPKAHIGRWATFRRVVNATFKILVMVLVSSRLHSQTRIVWDSFGSGIIAGGLGSYGIVSVLGQPFVGTASAGSFTVTNGFGAYVISMGVTAGVSAANRGIPLTYSLSQNYPNPFNPSTTLEFGLPEASRVAIVVYDVIGREAATLASEDFSAGYHSIRFSPQNLASGVYFYRIVATKKGGEMFVNTKKMMLLK